MFFLIKPIITEKATLISKLKNVYTFIVSLKTNKLQIKKLIQDRYNVSVKNVRTIIYIPKITRRNIKGSFLLGKSNKIKKALVELEKNQLIDFYNNIQ